MTLVALAAGAQFDFCCKSFVSSDTETAKAVASLLNITLPSNIGVGLSCNPITPISSCSPLSEFLTCDTPDPEWAGLIALNCVESG
ncbi:hypothetical protein K438DRAFT_1987939 [Mycena galopus ATCC 62051]|nr:hypothetical protein K438DRAFT_1987939 [Mycena galopus ATCC 62051]